MKTYLYLSTAIISVSLAAGGEAWAQCVSTQDCTALGYTETSCPNGGVKCPFGSKWFCASTEITPEQCTELGFTQTCTGTNQTGGSGSTCNKKYNICKCASGYTWDIINKTCKKTSSIGYSDGNYYYCDGKIVGVRATGMDFYVALKDLSRMNWSASYDACLAYSFCGDVRGVLPKKEQLTTLYNNKSQINSLLSANGGTKLSEGYYWSSTYYNDDIYYYIVSMADGDVGNYYQSNTSYVRPILNIYD